MSNKLIKDCQCCQQVIKNRLSDCKDWEKRKKVALNKIQEERCTTEKSKKDTKIKNNAFKMKINLQIVKQKQKNKNNHQIRIITKIYHIIAKKKEKK